MSASPDRLAQVDAQLAALGVDEASAQTRVLRLLEQRPRDLDAIDAALNGLAEGLDLASGAVAGVQLHRAVRGGEGAARQRGAEAGVPGVQQVRL